jgi:hypothetical protein
MTDVRRDDNLPGKSWFRTDRLVNEGGRWFFITREQTVEGPFDSRAEAIERLAVYVRLAENDLLPTEVTRALMSREVYAGESNG